MKKTIANLVVILFLSSCMLIACSGGKGSKGSAEQAAKENKGSKGSAEQAAKEKWTSLSATVPKMVEALQSKLDSLSKTSKLPANLPANVSPTVLAEATSGLASGKDEWNKAEESYKAGKVTDAVAGGTSAKDKLSKAMEALGMTVPAGTQ